MDNNLFKSWKEFIGKITFDNLKAIKVMTIIIKYQTKITNQ
jgi:hypothetical protein